MSEENLWGDLPVEEKIETPVSILRSQGVVLNKSTKGVLDGRIVQSTNGTDLYYEFRIVAPALGNYSATILTIRHPMALYPLFVGSEALQGAKQIANPEGFKLVLKEILQSSHVRRLVSGLLAQAHEAATVT